MKVFISWSGRVSNEIATAISNWIPDVMQGTEVFLSSQDIAKGERNAKAMWDALDGFEFGLSVVTEQNKNAPWIMFEAGAMMRFPTGRVVPILCNLDRLDITNTPLNSFQCSTLSKADMLAVAQSMNGAAGSPLSAEKLTRSFERWWPDLEKQISSVDLSQDVGKIPMPMDQSEHFKRLENGITAIMRTVDKIYMDREIERARSDAIREYSSQRGMLNDPDLQNILKWAAAKPVLKSESTGLSALQEALRRQAQDDASKNDDNNGLI